jgi:hypothetical protein
MTVHPGRFSAGIEGDFVVFLIGMRINKPMKNPQMASGSHHNALHDAVTAQATAKRWRDQ